MKSKYSDEQMKSMKFGLLTPFEPFVKENKKRYWRCKCDCGKTVERVQSYLTGKKRNFSCGCANKAIQPGGIKGNEHHGWKGCGSLDGQYLSTVRCRARKLDIEYDITAEEAWEEFVKQEGKCKLTGLSLNFESFRARLAGQLQTASLDRIDSKKGYVSGNIQWVHKDVNRMKNAYDQDYFIQICCLIADRSRSDGPSLATAA